MNDKLSYPSIKSFVRHHGRLTLGQQKALSDYWIDYGIDFSNQPIDLSYLKDFDKVVLEIGFGNGESLVEMAVAAPDTLFIGIEVHRPGVGRALMLAHENKINNLRVIEHDAVEVIKTMLPANLLDRIQVFFPDPWHKKRHKKRRLIQEQLCQLFYHVLKPQGVLHIATDWVPYAEHCLDVLMPMTIFKNLSSNQDYVDKPSYRPETKFERRGLKLGHVVNDLLFQTQ